MRIPKTSRGLAGTSAAGRVALAIPIAALLLVSTLSAAPPGDKPKAAGSKPDSAAAAKHEDDTSPYSHDDPALVERLKTPEENLGHVIGSGAFDYSLETLDLDLKDVAAKFENALEARDAAAFAAVLAEDVTGSMFEGLLTGSDGVDAVTTGPSKRFLSGRAEFEKAAGEYLANFSLVYDGFCKVKKYLGQSHSRRVHAKMKTDLRAIRTDGSIHHEHLVWRVAFRRADESSDWLVDRMYLIEREQRNAPKSLFREVTTSAGLYATESPFCAITGLGNIHLAENATQYDYGGVCVYDIDGDGDLDVFMPDAYGNFGLFMNRGDGTFANEIEGSGIVSVGGTRGAVFGDLDNDGDADLFICRAPHHHPSIPLNSNSLFENLGGGKFREITTPAGVRRKGASMTPVLLDYDRDGDLDIYVVNYGFGEAYRKGEHHPYNATHGEKNVLYRNDGKLKFTEVTDPAGLGKDTYWSYAVAVTDWNKDLWPDIYVANDFGPNNFYVNQGDGTFVDRAEELGILDVGNGMGATFVDYDRDTHWDLYVTNMQSSTGQRVLSTAKDLVSDEDMKLLWKLTLGNVLFRGTESGKFTASVAEDLGVNNCEWAWNADFADFDADADLDLIVVNGYYSGVESKDC